MMKMNSVRLASAALAAVFAAPCLSSASIILGGCEQLDPNPYMQEAAQASAELGGDQSVSVTCLNDDGVPVKRVYTYMQSNGQYSTTEQPLSRAMRALNYARTRNGAYIIGAGVVTAVGVVVYKSYRNTRAVSAAPEAAEVAKSSKVGFRERFFRNSKGVSRPHVSSLPAKTYLVAELVPSLTHDIEFKGQTIPRGNVLATDVEVRDPSTGFKFIARGKGKKARLIQIDNTAAPVEVAAPEIAEVGEGAKKTTGEALEAAGDKVKEVGEAIADKGNEVK